MLRDLVEKEDVLEHNFEGWVGFDRQIVGVKSTRGRENSVCIDLCP